MMFNLRLDRVIRRTAADSKQVYSLLLADEGLYIFHTGIVGGLVSADAGAGRHQIMVDERSMPLIEAMIRSEARVQSLPPEDLVRESGHALIPFESMTEVQQGRAALAFKTSDDSFDFLFTHSDETEISVLVARLRSSIGKSHADD